MSSNGVRPPAVAGIFYPAHRAALAREIATLLDDAGAARGTDVPVPKALIVPHAGYIYSGPVAAHAFRRLAAGRGIVRRVVLIGPAHRVALDGLALPSAHAFDTPFGRVAVDRALVSAVSDLPQVTVSGAAHAFEHALEVQLPFLQEVLGEISMLPLVVGRADAAAVAAVLERVWGGAETVVVVSSDLSHYLPYAEAQRADAESVRMILRGAATLSHERACGGTPVNGLLLAGRRAGLVSELLDLRNSGDTAGDRARVVGYCAVAFNPAAAQARDRGATLTGIARAAIAERLGLAESSAANEGEPWLRAPGATFVTLRYEGELRGCIGSLEATRALGADVRANALAAAFRDPRFPPLASDELSSIRIEVSLLAAATALPHRDEADALRQLRPGVDGVILRVGERRATFLPQVWEHLMTPHAFMAQLKRKAGLPADFWSERVELSRYTVTSYEESESA